MLGRKIVRVSGHTLHIPVTSALVNTAAPAPTHPRCITVPSAAGYLMVQFRSDASITAKGFEFFYSTSAQPPPQACRRDERPVSFFIQNQDNDVYDIAWMVLASSGGGSSSSATATSSNSRMAVAAGGYMPSAEELKAAATDGAWKKLLSWDGVEQGLKQAAELADASGVQYRHWSVATEVRCLKENADYQLVPLASDMSSWAGASITVVVPGSETLLVFNGSAEDPAKGLGDGVFRVPAQKDSEVIHSVGEGSGRQWLSVVAQWEREGPAGFQGVLQVSGDVKAEEVQGPVRGALRMALASSVEGVTNNVILIDAKGSSGGSSGSGRKLLARQAGAGKPAGSVQAGAGAARKLQRAAGLAAAAGRAAGSRRGSGVGLAAARAAQAANALRHLAAPQPYVAATHGWRRALQEDSSSAGSVLIGFRIIGA